MDVKELRTSKRLSQQAFADSVGFSRFTIVGIETGRKRLTEKVAAKIKEVYGVDVDGVTTGKAAPRKAVKAATDKAADEAATSKTVGKAGKTTVAKKGIIIQSPMGGEISPDEIISKIAAATAGQRVGTPDTVYIRVDENKAYWVKGKKNGSVDLW